MKLSIVTTLYMSEPHIQEFYKRIVAAAQSLTTDYEVVFVNDGSPDRSLDCALELAADDPSVRVVDLSRNFGHHRAMMTGLAHADGDYIFLIDSDLEESPEELLRFWRELTDQEGAIDVIYGVQARRRGGLFERFSGWLFYTTINAFCDVAIPRNFLTIRLMTRRYVAELVKYDERELVFSTLTELAGFKKKPVVVEKDSASQSTYDIARKFSLVVNTIASTSAKPLWFIFYTGLLITCASLLFTIYLVMIKLLSGVGADGWTSLIVSIWFFGGLFTLFLGVIGIYISRIYIEAKKRPYVSIRGRYGWPASLQPAEDSAATRPRRDTAIAALANEHAADRSARDRVSGSAVAG